MLQSLCARLPEPHRLHWNTVALLSEMFFRVVRWHKSHTSVEFPEQRERGREGGGREAGPTNAESAGYQAVWAQPPTLSCCRRLLFESLFRGSVKPKMQSYFLQDYRSSWMFQLSGSVHFIYSSYLLRLLWVRRHLHGESAPGPFPECVYPKNACISWEMRTFMLQFSAVCVCVCVSDLCWVFIFLAEVMVSLTYKGVR